jgi:hypothetical protein
MNFNLLGLAVLSVAVLFVGAVCFWLYTHTSSLESRVARVASQALRPRDVYKILQEQGDNDRMSEAERGSTTLPGPFGTPTVIESAVGKLLQSAIGQPDEPIVVSEPASCIKPDPDGPSSDPLPPPSDPLPPPSDPPHADSDNESQTSITEIPRMRRRKRTPTVLGAVAVKE